MKFLHWLPENERRSALSELSGQMAVKFKACYFDSIPEGDHRDWVTLIESKNGWVVKTAPDRLMRLLFETMEKYNASLELLEVL